MQYQIQVSYEESMYSHKILTNIDMQRISEYHIWQIGA